MTKCLADNSKPWRPRRTHYTSRTQIRLERLTRTLRSSNPPYQWTFDILIRFLDVIRGGLLCHRTREQAHCNCKYSIDWGVHFYKGIHQDEATAMSAFTAKAILPADSEHRAKVYQTRTTAFPRKHDSVSGNR